MVSWRGIYFILTLFWGSTFGEGFTLYSLYFEEAVLERDLLYTHSISGKHFWRGIYFILTLFWGSIFGSIFMLGPFSPLMFVNPSWCHWINNCLVATRLTLPVALLETMFGVKVIITGEAFVPGERTVIMNHPTRMD